jgi:hypothetical protein
MQGHIVAAAVNPSAKRRKCLSDLWKANMVGGCVAATCATVEGYQLQATFYFATLLSGCVVIKDRAVVVQLSVKNNVQHLCKAAAHS